MLISRGQSAGIVSTRHVVRFLLQLSPDKVYPVGNRLEVTTVLCYISPLYFADYDSLLWFVGFTDILRISLLGLPSRCIGQITWHRNYDSRVFSKLWRTTTDCPQTSFIFCRIVKRDGAKSALCTEDLGDRGPFLYNTACCVKPDSQAPGAFPLSVMQLERILFHQGPRLRMHGALPPLPPQAITVLSTGTSLHSSCYCMKQWDIL
jgi:hypothetical protein